MNFLNVNFTAVFFAATALATSLHSDSTVLLRSEDVLHKPYAVVVADPGVMLARRQALNGTGDQDIPRNSDGTLNTEAWNTITDAACKESLGQLPKSTNPSGHCVCYNLPSLDAQSGVFEADLRLYRVSEPREGFATVRPEEVMVDVAYSGATVSKIDQDNVTATGMVGSMSDLKAKRAVGNPELVQIYLLAGKINDNQMKGDMNMAQLEALVMPILTLTANNSTGSRVTTTVSLNEASFLTGVFANEVVVSDFGASKASVDRDRQALRDGQIAFVLPGVNILVFPIGLIITSSWMIIGFAAYGYGTIQRMNYAEMYRRQKAAGGRPKNTI